MKINKIISKLDKIKIKQKALTLLGKREDALSILYCDLHLGSIKIRTVAGICLRLRRKGLNTKIKIGTSAKGVNLEQNFFTYAPHFLDCRFTA
jgi:ribosomal protein L19